ncbi:MAG: hypothetical protein E6J99_09810, partial [Methanobacteriota archaeon]
MHWRSAVLLIVAGAGILIAIAAPKLIVLQSLVMVSSAMLGVVAVVLVRRGARSLPSDPRIARVSQRLHELRRLAAAARQQSLANLDGNPESIAVYPWPEEEDVVRVEDHSVARRLTERLAPPAPETSVDHRPSHNETFAELLREGEDLRALGRLLKLDLTAYGNQLSKALAAARAGRFEQCGLYLQV